MAAIPLLWTLNCQNNTDTGATTEERQSGGTVAANTLTFKLNGAAVELIGIAHTKGTGESFIGKQADGSYINYGSATTAGEGTFTADKNSAPAYVLQYVQGGVSHTSDGGTANVTFSITVTATEISGTFSGTVRRNDGTILPVSDGQFRVNK